MVAFFFVGFSTSILANSARALISIGFPPFALEVTRADQLGWQGLAAEHFTSRKLALVILSSNRWPTLRRVAARIAAAVDFVQTGQSVKVDVAIW